MKIFIYILIILFAKVSLAQKDSITKIERFIKANSSFIKKEITVLETINKCQIQIIKATNLLSQNTEIGLRFEYEFVKQYGVGTPVTRLLFVNYLDKNELDGFINALEIAKKEMLSKTPSVYTEYAYKSFSNMKFIAAWRDKIDFKGFEWVIELKLDSNENSTVQIENKDLDKLVKVLKTNIAQIK